MPVTRRTRTDRYAIDQVLRAARGPLALASGAFLLLALALPTGAQAQTMMSPGLPSGSSSSGDDTVLDAIDGQTDLQRRVGESVNVTCNQLAEISSDFTSDTDTRKAARSDIEDLFDRCSELVATGADLSGVSATGGMGMGMGGGAEILDLDAAGLNEALQELAPDEIPSASKAALETAARQIQNLTARTAALRAGAGGFAVSGLSTLLARRGDVDPSLLAALDEPAAAGSAEGPFGAFLNVTGGFGHREGGSELAEYEFSTVGTTLGVDYRFTDQLVAGVAFGYSFTDNEIDRDAGDVNVNAFGGSIFGTYYGEDWYVDVLGSYSRNDYDTHRKIRFTSAVREAVGDTEGDEFTAAFGGGYTFRFGGLSLEPRARFEYISLNIDGFTETGAQGLDLEFDDDSFTSLTTLLGLNAAYAISTDFAVLQPQIRAGWKYEFMNNSEMVTARFAADPFRNTFFVNTESPDRNFMEVGFALTAAFPGGFSAFFDFDATTLNRNFDRYTFTVGGRYQF